MHLPDLQLRRCGRVPIISFVRNVRRVISIVVLATSLGWRTDAATSINAVNKYSYGANLGWKVREGSLCYSPGTNCPNVGANGDPLVAADGTKITSAGEWRGKRRPELLALFTREMYGRGPGRPPVTVQAMDEAIAAEVQARRARGRY